MQATAARVPCPRQYLSFEQPPAQGSINHTVSEPLNHATLHSININCRTCLLPIQCAPETRGLKVHAFHAASPCRRMYRDCKACVQVQGWCQGMCQNRARQRRRHRHALPDWAHLYQHALNADVSQAFIDWQTSAGWQWPHPEPDAAQSADLQVEQPPFWQCPQPQPASVCICETTKVMPLPWQSGVAVQMVQMS